MHSLPPQLLIFAKKNIKRLCSQGQIKQAVDSLDLLARKGLRLDTKTIAFLLQQCANSKSIRQGKCLHQHLNFTGFKRPNTFLANHLINMYSKCGDHAEARKVFNKLTTKNLYSWNSMLSGYAKLGMLKPAHRLFEKMPEKDIVSWNIMIIAYARSGYTDKPMRLYRESRASNIAFDEYTFAGVITVCVKAKELSLVRQVHCQALVSGCLSKLVLPCLILGAYAICGEMGDARRLFDATTRRDALTWITLLSGYAKWGDMKSARELFNTMPKKSPGSWTSLIAGYARNGCSNEAIILFAEMMKHQFKPDQFTFSSCLSACASIPSLVIGKQIHALLIVTGLQPNRTLLRSLIDMYSKCESLEAEKRASNILVPSRI